jgi:aconitate hydratase
MRVAAILKGKKVHPNTSLVISPGSKQVFEMLARNGALSDLISSGARILESSCGPCIGMGQSPCSGAVSVRTFNRNFEGRSGTADAKVYLASPESAAAAAITGHLTDPRELGADPQIAFPSEYLLDDSMILSPSEDPQSVQVRRGPNIKPLPVAEPLRDSLTVPVLLKTGDNITTDHIMPAGSKILPLRSNIPAISKFVFNSVDHTFAERALTAQGGIVLGGHNYGQGSSREHAALAPMYLGVKAVIAKSFARIHRANLINFGILPLTFLEEEDYSAINQGDDLELQNLHQGLQTPSPLTLLNKTTGKVIAVEHNLTPRQARILLAGGLLNFTKQDL